MVELLQAVSAIPSISASIIQNARRTSAVVDSTQLLAMVTTRSTASDTPSESEAKEIREEELAPQADTPGFLDNVAKSVLEVRGVTTPLTCSLAPVAG